MRKHKGRHEEDDLLRTLRRWSSLQSGGKSGLTGGFFAERLFVNCLGWISGGRRRRAGGVLLERFFENTDTIGQHGALLLQASNDLVTLSTTRAGGFIHTDILVTTGANNQDNCVKIGNLRGMI